MRLRRRRRAPEPPPLELEALTLDDFVARLELVDGDRLELEDWQRRLLRVVEGEADYPIGGYRFGREQAIARSLAAAALLGEDVLVSCADARSAGRVLERVGDELEQLGRSIDFDVSDVLERVRTHHPR